MAVLVGWNIDRNFSRKITLTEDVSEGQLVLASGAVAGAGEVAAGVVDRDVDISEDGTTAEIHSAGIMVSAVAAAITDLTVPIKVAASGTVTPCDTDQDYYVGWPMETQATVGGYVKYIWQPGYYATT